MGLVQTPPLIHGKAIVCWPAGHVESQLIVELSICQPRGWDNNHFMSSLKEVDHYDGLQIAGDSEEFSLKERERGNSRSSS